MLMIREWRHIKMLKRGGRAYDPGGVLATAPGSLAIPCRACPLPNINLPKGWENVPPERVCVLSICDMIYTDVLLQLALYVSCCNGCEFSAQKQVTGYNQQRTDPWARLVIFRQ